ncbi:DUF445 family protein [Chitinophaga polysaccharea]|uniref:DUF445 domain-containing protein n=1 Tax=Chitinophaga TaxID=79328 RepID=UPI0014559347|nr:MULTISPECIES: DUF445 family protein [Chitinophaga]NLR58757.1 DUF445 family protein [Chitinophaga polysaccharea]NLU91288.1 DUF445 family protein [Chitinophaga sp. Ak27]
MIFFLPVIAALIGWLLNSLATTLLFRPYQPVKIGFITLHGMFPKRQAQLAAGIGAMVAGSFSFEDIKRKLTDPEKIKKIIPLVETHLDAFLRERLPKAMPVLSMFIGDSIVNQIKSHLVAELDTLFPVLINQYLDNAEKDLDLEKMVTEKITAISAEELERTVHRLLPAALRQFKWLGALTGFITGLIAMGISLL